MRIYIILLFVGVTAGAFVMFFVITGLSLNSFRLNVIEIVASTWTSNNFARGLTIDFWTSYVITVTFAVVESKRIGMKNWLVYPLLFLVLYCFALPYFLLRREQHLRKHRTIS